MKKNEISIGAKGQEKNLLLKMAEKLLIAPTVHCPNFPIMDRPCNLKSFGMVAVSSDSVFLG